MHYRRERVRIETQRHEIEGTVQLPSEGYRSRTTDFLNAQGDPTLLMDIGNVPPEVGVAAGYPCASERGTG